MLARGRTLAAKVFIGYRRDDSAGNAGRIQDPLERKFGCDRFWYDCTSRSLTPVGFMRDAEPIVAGEHSPFTDFPLAGNPTFS